MGGQNGQIVKQFVIVPKLNGAACLHLYSARLNQTFIRPMHNGPTLNNVLPKLTNVHYITIIDTNSGYKNLKCVKKSSYLTMFACQFGRCTFTRLSFAVGSAGDNFQ